MTTWAEFSSIRLRYSGSFWWAGDVQWSNSVLSRQFAEQMNN